MGSFHSSLSHYFINQEIESAARFLCFNCLGSVSGNGSQLLHSAFFRDKELIPLLLEAGANPCDTSRTQDTCAFRLLVTMAEQNDLDLKIFELFVAQFRKKNTRPCVLCVRELVKSLLSAEKQKKDNPRLNEMMRYMDTAGYLPRRDKWEDFAKAYVVDY